MSHGVENYFPGQWGTGISDAILMLYFPLTLLRFELITVLISQYS